MMDSLFGVHFLKRFFGNRSHQCPANPAGDALILPENEAKMSDIQGPEAEESTEPVCPPGEHLPK